jgi:hypothetical protein
LNSASGAIGVLHKGSRRKIFSTELDFCPNLGVPHFSGIKNLDLDRGPKSMNLDLQFCLHILLKYLIYMLTINHTTSTALTLIIFTFGYYFYIIILLNRILGRREV